METVISSLISAAVTLLVCIVNNRAQAEKARVLIEYKLDELTKRVEKHNNLIERTYKLEEKAERAFDEFRRVNHRIATLEEDDHK